MYNYNMLNAIMGEELDEYNIHTLEKFPSVIDPGTGAYTQEFRTFINDVQTAIHKKDWGELFRLSDRATDSPSFIEQIHKMWGKHFDEYEKCKITQKHMNLDVHVERFKQPHKNILSSFHLVTYYIKENGDSLTDRGMKLHRHATEVWFTYKDNKFCIVSAFQPFVELS